MRLNGRIRGTQAIVLELIADSGKTAYELSKEMGCSKNKIKRWENGLNLPSVEDFDKLLEHLGYELKIEKKPLGLDPRARMAKDLGVSYGGLECREKSI